MLRRLILAAALAAIPAADAQAASLNWTPCDDGFECATAKVPLDYDQPKGTQISLAVIRLPGGRPGPPDRHPVHQPGRPRQLRRAVRARRGPRRLHRRRPGALRHRRVRPARRRGQHAGALRHRRRRSRPFPVGFEEERAFAPRPRPNSAAAAAPAPATLLDHLSTANVARDMDVLRAAVGDPKLTYIGHSYGSHLGATYANLFPHRVRAIALDGILDSSAWTTGPRARSRCASAASRRRATRCGYFLATCKAAGPDCAFSDGDPAAEFDALMAQLRKGPIGPFTYAQVVNIMRDVLGFTPGLEVDRRGARGGARRTTARPRPPRRRSTTATGRSSRSRARRPTTRGSRRCGRSRPGSPTTSRRTSAPRGPTSHRRARRGRAVTPIATPARSTARRARRCCWSTAASTRPRPMSARGASSARSAPPGCSRSRARVTPRPRSTARARTGRSSGT